MRKPKITADNLQSLAKYTHDKKGDWYTAANNRNAKEGLNQKAAILTEGFRQNGINAIVFVKPWSPQAEAISDRKTGDQRIITITDQAEILFATEKALGTITRDKKILPEFEKNVRSFAARPVSGISIDKARSFSHRDDGIVDRGGAKLKYVYSHG